MYNILIVEDDEMIFEELERLLVKHGYGVVDGRIKGNVARNFDLAVLDVKLPERSGYEICAEIRKTKTCPVIFLTSLNNPESELMGFAVGGDDFVSKPFNSAVLMARISRLLKTPKSDVIVKGGLTLDTLRLEVSGNGKTVQLSKTEFALLRILAEADGILPQKEIVERLWDNEAFVDENTLYVNVNRVREKIRELGLTDVIRTVRGYGYGLE